MSDIGALALVKFEYTDLDFWLTVIIDKIRGFVKDKKRRNET